MWCWAIDILRSSYDRMWSAAHHSYCCNCVFGEPICDVLKGIDRASDDGVDRYAGIPSSNRGTALGLRDGFLST